MLRPCFLVVDREQSGSISTRKLVIETAKFNVITAYSGAEALEALHKFPNVDGVVLDAGMRDVRCSELNAQLREFRPDLRIVVVGDLHKYTCDGASHRLDSFDPKQLLDLLQQLESTKTTQIAEHEISLAEESDRQL